MHNTKQRRRAKAKARQRIKNFMMRHLEMFYNLSSESRSCITKEEEPKLHRRFKRVRNHWDQMVLRAVLKGYIKRKPKLYTGRKLL